MPNERYYAERAHEIILGLPPYNLDDKLEQAERWLAYVDNHRALELLIAAAKLLEEAISCVKNKIEHEKVDRNQTPA